MAASISGGPSVSGKPWPRLMDPVSTAGREGVWTAADTRAMDLIGWDIGDPSGATPNQAPDAVDDVAQDALARSGGHGANHDPKVAMAVAEYNRRHLCRADPWPDFLEAALNGTNTTVYNTMWGPNEFTLTGNLATWDRRDRGLLVPAQPDPHRQSVALDQ